MIENAAHGADGKGGCNDKLRHDHAPDGIGERHHFLDDLAKAGKPDSARKVLKKYDEVMPTTINSLEIAVRKYYMIENAYRLNDIQLGNKLANLVDDYVSNQLDYSYALFQKGETNLENRDLQYSMQILGGLVEFSKQYKQSQLFNKFSAQLNGFEKKFGVTGKK